MLCSCRPPTVRGSRRFKRQCVSVRKLENRSLRGRQSAVVEATLDSGLNTPGSTITAQRLLNSPEPQFPHRSTGRTRTCRDAFSSLLEAASEGLSHIPSRLEEKIPKALRLGVTVGGTAQVKGTGSPVPGAGSGTRGGGCAVSMNKEGCPARARAANNEGLPGCLMQLFRARKAAQRDR